ncbi:MAG: 2-C-methyl-D-erythritol 2,4-cyclodiphosphate synthase [Ruminococcaceae bacterium]|nr:2-C-methyl-D-erythritol 2,4-cyclodiphosphate synthase [Oscillospiraceae bacterium]
MVFDVRVGTGYDVHILTENRKLILGGVDIPYERGLLGHSDADVLIHAIMDSLLGALSLGDIGKLFPDSKDEFKGISSILLLERVYEEIKKRNYRVNNIDSTVVCQRPKLAPYIDQMRENISRVLDVDIASVSVKATTTEKLGFEGEEKGISSQAVCTLIKEG